MPSHRQPRVLLVFMQTLSVKDVRERGEWWWEVEWLMIGAVLRGGEVVVWAHNAPGSRLASAARDVRS